MFYSANAEQPGIIRSVIFKIKKKKKNNLLRWSIIFNPQAQTSRNFGMKLKKKPTSCNLIASETARF